MEAFAFEFMEYIVDRALVLIPVLLTIGAMLKATPKCPDWCIPWVLMGVGVVLCLMLMGMSVDAAIQGTLVASAAVYGNQLWRQTKERSLMQLPYKR